MGESKRRKESLGNAYGTLDVNAQVKIAQRHINAAINHAQKTAPDHLIIQCANQDKGYCLDAINSMKNKLASWVAPLDIPILIQMLPEGFISSATQLFDGYITVWTNRPNYEVWQHLLDTKLRKVGAEASSDPNFERQEV
jgi:hypothetical protein